MSGSFLRRLMLVDSDSMTSVAIAAVAMTLSPANADDDDDNDADSDTAAAPAAAPLDIFVSQACLLIPVFVAAWWYYTKHWCRALVRGVLKNNPEESSNDDNAHRPTSSGRFARMEEAYFQSSWCVPSLIICGKVLTLMLSPKDALSHIRIHFFS